MIGLGFDCKLSQEITHGYTLHNLKQYLDLNGKTVRENVARDTIRGYFIENINDAALVHSAISTCFHLIPKSMFQLIVGSFYKKCKKRLDFQSHLY